MTTAFPLIEPNRRGYSFPDYPVGEASEWAGVTMLREQQLPVEQALTPGAPVVIDYEDITYADVRLIRLHWAATLHGAKAFAGNELIWPQEAGRRFRYASRPQEQQKKGGLYDVRVELEIDAAATYIGATILAIAAAVFARAGVPTVAAGGQSVFLPSAPVVTQALTPLFGVVGQTIAPPAAPVVAVAPAAAISTAGIVILPPAGAIISRGPVPAVVVGVGVSQPQAKAISRGPAPAFSTAGAVNTPPAGPVVSRGPVPALTVGVGVAPPAGTIVSAGPGPTITTAGGAAVVTLPSPAAIVTNGRVPASVAARTSPLTPITATFSQSAVGSGQLAADFATMTNGFLGETQRTRATNGAGGTWIQMDLGAPTAFGRIVIGSAYFTMDSFSPSILVGAIVEGSADATNWTAIRPSIGTWDLNAATLQEYETPGANWRYVRLRGLFTNLLVTELYVAA